jgi:amidophosphoribosyltransferase
MATRSELIAAQKSIEEIRDHIGADSLGYLSLDGTVSAANTDSGSHCDACFTGNYPSAVPLQLDKLAFESDIDDARDRHALPILKSG